MNGLDISRDYFNNTAKNALEEYFPELFPRLAAGLAGNGSECFGYDDEISRDHDWGADFFIWVQERDVSHIPELAQWKRQLLMFNPPAHARTRSEYGANISVMTCGDFFKQLIGVSDYPEDILQWFRIPENNLAMCVNGEVFMDNAGDFTAIRQRFLQYYPEDFRLKKISAKCMAIAQTGQYNHMRMAKRGETAAVFTVIARFIDSVTGMLFLLNRVYRPYYKWENRMLHTLPILGGKVGQLIDKLMQCLHFDEAGLAQQQKIISQICSLIHDELKRQELTSSDDWFFSTHGEEVRHRIKNQVLRSLPAQYE